MKKTSNFWIVSVLLIGLIIVGVGLASTWKETAWETDRQVSEPSLRVSPADPPAAERSGLTLPGNGVKQEALMQENSEPGFSRVPEVTHAAEGVLHNTGSRQVVGSIQHPAAAEDAPKEKLFPGVSPSIIPPSIAQGVRGGLPAALTLIPPQHVASGVPVANIPAAFGDQSVMGDLTDNQKAKIAQIADDFTTAVQSSGVAPNTPEYLQAWDTAAYRADEYFRGQFGIPAFNAMQMARVYQP